VIPATLSKPKHVASEYGQTLSDAPWENRIDTSRDLSDGIDPEPYCLQNSSSSDFGACDAA
jgi:hypothetical protein